MDHALPNGWHRSPAGPRWLLVINGYALALVEPHAGAWRWTTAYVRITPEWREQDLAARSMEVANLAIRPALAVEPDQRRAKMITLRWRGAA